jgi:hypothetical protein
MSLNCKLSHLFTFNEIEIILLPLLDPIASPITNPIPAASGNPETAIAEECFAKCDAFIGRIRNPYVKGIFCLP